MGQPARGHIDQRNKDQMGDYVSVSPTNQQWPLMDIPHAPRMDGRSPLDQTMLQPFAEEARQPTYTWQGRSAMAMHWMEGQIPCPTRQLLGISQAMWNFRQASKLIKLPNCADSCGKNCRRQASSIPTTQQQSKEPQQNTSESSNTRKLWEHMRAFKSSFQ